MINNRIIEVEVTEEDLQKMRADGIVEADLPPLGIKKYRSARHISKDKIVVLLDADIVEHFKKTSENDDAKFYQTRINQTLRKFIEG